MPSDNEPKSEKQLPPLGYVDNEDAIRRPKPKSALPSHGEKVAYIDENSAYKYNANILIRDEQLGYIDKDGNVHEASVLPGILPGAIVGEVGGRDKREVLGRYVLRYQNFLDRVDELESKINSTTSKGVFLNSVERLIEQVNKVPMVGDRNTLVQRLEKLKWLVRGDVLERTEAKRRICEKAEQLRESSDWKKAGAELKALLDGWKSLGVVDRDTDDWLWKRLRKAVDRFHERKKAHFAEREKHWEENREKKTRLCKRAEALSSSREWAETSAAMKQMMNEWKEIKWAGPEHDSELWERFSQARSKFFERRAAHFEAQNTERQGNATRKEKLCDEVEALAHRDNIREAIEQTKAAQLRWKSIGPVPRERNDELWGRFRSACTTVFEAAREHYESKREEWQNKLRSMIDFRRDKVAKLRESIEHDQGNIERWQETIRNLRDGGRADEIRESLESKIADVEARIESKAAKIDELEESATELESKL